ncbi:hypothetical protein ScPMuIL_014726 [Solemya velum]
MDFDLKEIFQQLKIAIENERTDIVRAMLSAIEQNNIDNALSKLLNESFGEDGTMLHFATKLGHTDTVRLLLASGADPGVHNSDQKTPLDLASSQQVTRVYNQHLLQAIAASDVGSVCQLLAAGVDVNLVDSPETKSTPLHWAASYGNHEVVQCLCSRGADVNHCNVAGITPLHEAVKRGEMKIIQELINSGADTSIVALSGEFTGKSPLDMASDKPDIWEVLQSAPMKPTSPIQMNNHTGLPGGEDPVLNRVGNSYGDVTDLLNGATTNGYRSSQLTSPVFRKSAPFDDITSPPHPVITEESLNLLWPQPQNIIQNEGSPFSPKDKLPVFVVGGPGKHMKNVMNQWKLRKPEFEAFDLDLTVDVFTTSSDLAFSHIMCHVNRRLCPGHGMYKITITHKQLKIIANDCNALHFAIATIVQLFRLYCDDGAVHIPLLLIDDWPELHYRGIVLDISQGRLPTLETLMEMINSLSLLKVNQVYLFSRFKKPDNPEWQLHYSRGDIMDLEEYSLLRGIQLLPLLEVSPKVQFEDVAEMYTVFHDFMSCFSSADFVSLGPRLSSFILDTTDDGDLNVNDANKLLPLTGDQTLQLCGYPLHDLDPQLLHHLPPHIALTEFGVQADYDFRKFCKPLSEQGVSFFVCPGTAGWNSLAGCPEAAINNVNRAVRCAIGQGALGIIVCNWSGKGHLTQQPFSWSGFLVGAGLGWNSECHLEFLFGNLGELLNRHVFQDTSSVTGHVIIELGRAETYILRCSRNQAGNDCFKLPDDQGSTLFQLLLHPDEVAIENLTQDCLQRSVRHVRKCQSELTSATLQCKQGEQIVSELSLTCDLLIFAARLGRALVLAGRNPGGHTGYAVVNLGITNLQATTKTDLANKFLEVIEAYKTIWAERYMPSIGLQESLNVLQKLFKQFVPNQEPSALLTPDVSQ